MSLNILKQEIAFGLENLTKVYVNIETFSQLDVDPKIKVSALTYECLGYYNAIEHLIIRTLKYLNIELPSGKFSHRDILRQFEIVLTDKKLPDPKATMAIIANLMAFRHVATKIYGFLIDADKLNGVISDIEIHHGTIEQLFQALIQTL